MAKAAIIGRVSVKVFPDTSDFRRDTQRKLTAIEKQLKLNIKPEVDLEHATRDLKHWANKNDPINLKVKLDLSAPSKKVVGTELKVLTRPRDVDILPRLNKAATAKVGASLAALSGARALTDTFDKLGNVLKNLDKSVPKIAAVATAVAGLAAWGLTAAANLAALSASLASIAPAGLALPGIFAGIAIGLGTTLIALNDLKHALPDVAQQWSDMKATISQQFFSKAGAGIRQLADEFLPHLSDVAAEVGTFWGKLAKDLSAPLKSQIGPMFDNLRDSIAIANKNTGVFARVVTDLGVTGSKLLPRLAQWFANIANTFADWLDRVSASGELQGWIDGALEGLHQLGQVAKNAFGILSGISKAALQAGGSGLTPFAATLERVNKVVNSPAFQKGLVDTLHAAFAAMHNISTTAGPAVIEMFKSLSNTLTSVFPMVGHIIGTVVKAIANVLGSSAVQSGIKNLFAGIDSAVSSLAPVIEGMAPLLGQLLSTIGTFAAQLGPLFGAAFQALGGVLQEILPALTPVIHLLAGTLTDTIRALTPALLKLAKAFVKMIEPIAKVLAPVLDKLMPVLIDVANQFADLAAGIMPELGKAFADVLTAVAPLLPSLIKLGVGAMLPMLKLLGPLLALLGPLASVLQVITTVLSPLLNAITALNDLAGKAADVVFSHLLDVLKVVGAVLIGPTLLAFRAVASFLSATLAPVVKALAAIFVGNFRAMAAIAQWFGNVLKPIFSLLVSNFNALKALVGVVAFAWQASFKLIAAAAQWLWGTILSPVFSAIKTAAGAVGKALGAIGDGLRTAWDHIISPVLGSIRDTVGVTRDAIKSAIDTIKGLWGHIADGLKWAYDHVIKPVLGAIQGAIDAVTNALNSLTTKVTKGKNLGQGFIGSDGRVHPVNGVGQVAMAKGGTVLPTPGGTLALLAEAGKAETVVDTGKMNALIGRILSSDSASGSGGERTFNYYAAPGNSLNSEEDLFAAVGRSRFAW